ncbi:MAG TPA: ThuA domain-containing protein [Spirochaetia bacterium]|nr:ThuA domain-containing protein [Spirochaetia bacterium]
MAGRIAALVGDYYHKAGPMLEALETVARALSLSLEPFEDPLALSWDRLQPYRALVVAREDRMAPPDGKAVWAGRRHETALAEYVQAGGALLVLHAGLASYPTDGPWFETVRGAFQFHPSEHPRFSVRGRNAPSADASRHAVLEGFSPFEIQDEQYFVRVDSARTTCLLDSASADYGTSCAAWAHGVGKGRVFCFTPGHNPPVLENPSYRSVLNRGFRWALNEG